MFSDGLEESINRAIVIKELNCPEILYKYRKCNPEHLGALFNNFLIASSPTSLNDPYEGILDVNPQNLWGMTLKQFIDVFDREQGTKTDMDLNQISSNEDFYLGIINYLQIPKEDWCAFESINAVTIKAIDIIYHNLENDLHKVNEKLYRICSLSESFNSQKMWSLYAEEHTGFCLGYDIKSMNNDIFALTFPVIYSDKPIEINEEYLNNDKYRGIIQIKSITQKAIAWKDEMEWRIVVSVNNSEKKQKILFNHPKEIILGSKIDASSKDKLINYSRQNDISCYQIKRKKSTYELVKEILK